MQKNIKQNIAWIFFKIWNFVNSFVTNGANRKFYLDLKIKQIESKALIIWNTLWRECKTVSIIKK